MDNTERDLRKTIEEINTQLFHIHAMAHGILCYESNGAIVVNHISDPAQSFSELIIKECENALKITERWENN